jgi:Zn-dependent M16 (insulinase) family peptidase
MLVTFYVFRTYIDTAYTALIGKPSQSLSVELIETERKRIENQRAMLGEEGLKILGAKLDHANRMNEAQIPSRIMEGFPIPSVSSISSIEVLTAVNPYYDLPTTKLSNNSVQAHVNRDGHVKDIPYFIQYDRKLF